MKKVIIFDMNGVIIDSEPIHKIVEKELYKKLNIEVSDAEQDSCVGTSEKSWWSIIKEKHNLTETVDYLIESKKKAYLDKLSELPCLLPIDGIVNILEMCKEKEIKLAIASSSALNIIEFIIRKLDVEKYFEFILSGEQVRESKPAPDIFLKVAEHFGDECSFLVIEDSRNGVCAAKEAGMKCVGYRNLNSGNQDLSRADLIIESFDEENIIKVINLFA